MAGTTRKSTPLEDYGMEDWLNKVTGTSKNRRNQGVNSSLCKYRIVQSSFRGFLKNGSCNFKH